MIVDNTILDELYSERINFIRDLWSEKHRPTVEGVVLITLV